MKFIQYFRKPSISKKLVLSFLFILLCPIIVLAFSSYHTASTSLNDQIMQSAKENVEQLDKNITKVVKVKTDAADFFSKWITEKKLKQKGTTDIQGRFEQFMSMNDDTEGVFVASSDGKVFSRYPNKKCLLTMSQRSGIGIKTAGRKTESCLFQHRIQQLLQVRLWSPSLKS